jgi:hypothetical protein
VVLLVVGLSPAERRASKGDEGDCGENGRFHNEFSCMASPFLVTERRTVHLPIMARSSR